MFFPDRLPDRDGQIAAIDAHHLFRKGFFAAQLRYYGMKIPARSKSEELEGMLREAVVAGKTRFLSFLSFVTVLMLMLMLGTSVRRFRNLC